MLLRPAAGSCNRGLNLLLCCAKLSLNSCKTRLNLTLWGLRNPSRAASFSFSRRDAGSAQQSRLNTSLAFSRPQTSSQDESVVSIWRDFRANDGGLNKLRRNDANGQLHIQHVALGPDPVSFDYIWLRDNCQCSQCIHPSTQQKLHLTTDVPSDIRPNDCTLSDDAQAVVLSWDRPLENTDPGAEFAGTQAHTSVFDIDFLKKYTSDESIKRARLDLSPVHWNANDLKTTRDSHFFSWEAIRNSKEELALFLHRLRSHGLAFVNDLPTDNPEEDPALQQLTSALGEVRHTFYGRFWDVKAVPNSINIAFTNLNLGLHMDLLYFENPPHYQFLHCLRNKVKGGESIFVDSFKAAEMLYQTFPQNFKLLSQVLVTFHYVNNNHHMYFNHPTIEIERDAWNDVQRNGKMPRLAHVNYSPPFQGPLEFFRNSSSLAGQQGTEFHLAFQRFAHILSLPEMQYELTLKEGQCVVFDNRRTLHARRSFGSLSPRSPSQDDEGPEVKRWLKGCYMDGDVIRDRYRVLT